MTRIHSGPCSRTTIQGNTAPSLSNSCTKVFLILSTARKSGSVIPPAHSVASILLQSATIAPQNLITLAITIIYYLFTSY